MSILEVQTYVWYASLNLITKFRMHWKASCQSSSEDVEGFFRRVLALDVANLLENGAASLTDLPELLLGLP